MLIAALPFLVRNMVPRGSPVVDLKGEGGEPLKDLIRRVKRELGDAELERVNNHEAALFELKQFDLEVSFISRARAAGKGTVDYELIAVNNEVEVGSEHVQNWSYI